MIQFQNIILDWAEQNLKKYPWRSNRTPYRILICEIILTRTKAVQVVPVFKKFMKIYPTIEDFLDMKQNSVKRLIKSLGLKKRAEQLNEIASELKARFDGKIPAKFSDLKSLKGIGDYNANAILCFGFNQRRPLLDSNFIRLFKRVFNVVSKTKTAKSDRYLWQFSEELLPDKSYVDFNYGILDIGGNICQNRKPKCDICPLNIICCYYKNQEIISTN